MTLFVLVRLYKTLKYMSNININVSISLDKTVLATLVGLLGGPLGVE